MPNPNILPKPPEGLASTPFSSNAGLIGRSVAESMSANQATLVNLKFCLYAFLLCKALGFHCLRSALPPVSTRERLTKVTMRNLRIVDIDETAIPEGLPLSATALDASNDSIICAFGPTSEQPVIELKRHRKQVSERSDGCAKGSLQTITSWDAPCPLPNLECDEILLMHYFQDTVTTCLVLAGGDIVVVREDPSPDQERIEIVGSVDAGICAAAWAPDEELLAIVTRADTLVLMSKDFEPVTETTLTADDLKASKHVSVGWGKKETQFHGKRVKAMKDPTMPDTVDEGKPSAFEDGKISISWRGDGAFVAINSMVPRHRRVIRVFTREAALDSASEPVDGLESALTWRPSGNLIAGIKRSKEQTEVVLFERNGLRHGEFDLRLKKSDMGTWASAVSLAWNIDSTVLAVTFRDRVQFWTTGNYHYYLKQEVMLNEMATPIAKLSWHAERPLQCAIYTNTSLLNLTLLPTVKRGSTIAPDDYGIVAVVDGQTLKLSPLKHAGVPPPMSFCEIQIDATIIDCAISRDGRRLAILAKDHIAFCDWQMRSLPSTKASKPLSDKRVMLRHTTNILKREIALPSPLSSAQATLRPVQIAMLGDQAYVLCTSKEGAASRLFRCSITTEKDEDLSNGDMDTGFSEVNLSESARNLVTDTDQNTIWCQTGRTTTLISSSSDTENIELGGAQPDSSIFRLYAADQNDPEGTNSGLHKISLTPKGLLYVDQRVLARDCTSFVLTDAHLLFTTSQHLLKFVHLTTPEQMEVPGDTPEVDERCRSVERGAKIVTVIPSSYAVVLQMPRGNLETIYPRVLVLSGIRRHIDELDYRSAFLACQSQQVDMNILYDHRPDLFMANASSFIDQLKKPSRVDEFLSKLKDEDVTQTLYKDTLKIAAPEAGNDVPSKNTTGTNAKANTICEVVLAELSLKPSTYLQNKITAYVCKRPPDLKQALSLISSLRESSAEEADLAVSHLCFLTDTNRLYDAALSLYDLELTLLVAQNAQRDPREYMPFLQSLQALPVLRRQYQIDNHLKNYAKALTSLRSMDAHDEVEAYSVKHNLYTHAMELYKYDAARLATMTRLYADYLASQSQHASAATLYESLNDHSAAYPLYALAHQWRESLTCASLILLDGDRLRNHATSLASTCADESRDYRAAATIHLEYLKDVPTAARHFCKGSYFADATRVLALHGLKDEITHIVDTGLTEKFGEIIELVADCKSQLTAQIPRIKELRQKKEEDPLAFYGGDTAAMNGDGVDIPDNVSLAATDASTVGGQSLFTRYGSNASKFGGTVASNVSRQTSRTKRREERKRARGKKGSVYEEEYLVSSVARLVDRVNGVQDEVKRLVAGMLRRGMREQAAKVDEVMKQITEQCGAARKEVWQVEDERVTAGRGNGTYDVNGEGRPSGADGVLWDSQMEMNGQGGKKEPPEVKAWAPNALI